jgi:hypothetical protein
MTHVLSVRRLLAPAALALALIALAAPGTARAQQVIQPSHQKKLDPVRLKLRGDLLALGDSLMSVQAAIARFEREPEAASDAVQISRARVLARACRNAQLQVAPTRATVRDTKLGPDVAKRQSALLAEFEPLTRTLAACDTTFQRMSQPKNAQETREWGLHRAHKLRDALAPIQRLTNDLFGAAGIQLTPPSATGSQQG